ncbi:hypothetical protein [Brevibacillus laterosporus]|uniref:hypothetical protein n=1 Tax=Brevibacillus laterosporus TaxID=1465 RepID=UPI0026520F00|nr:hypothetical protein [Brevibacillus laterosporus]MDN9012752.1 hypothetical protein [Brevibacillus laterosporus]MDO0943823.1 hypothetical protein [Brevibacillus laterosporus]
MPPRAEWEAWLANNEGQDDISIKIRYIQQMEEYGAEVLVISADVADEYQMRDVIAQAESSDHRVIFLEIRCLMLCLFYKTWIPIN